MFGGAYPRISTWNGCDAHHFFVVERVLQRPASDRGEEFLATDENQMHTDEIPRPFILSAFIRDIRG